ncbi:MAG: hypothetical protein JRJ03_11975 [Deltaproteobacteria bacterium]|nr:hypothetical protein [Deltaproteobacteria bacterium]
MPTAIPLKRFVLFAATCLLMTFPETTHGAKWSRVLEKEDVVIIYEESMEPAAEETAGIYPAIRTSLEAVFQWRLDFRPTIYLVRRNKEFQRMAATDIIVAFALPSKKLIVIDYSRMKTDPFSIEVTLKHELCHLLLHEHIPEENLPFWLDEGLAQWMSGGISELITPSKRSLLKEATLAGRYVTLQDLKKRYAAGRDSLLLAYEASKSLVEFIIRKHGSERLLEALRYLETGHSLEEALKKGLSISQEDLEKAWHEDLRRRTTWINFLISNMYEILFFLAALIVSYGFLRALIKKRAYMSGMEDE